MPGLYAPYKTYSSGEILTAADLNATDTNHITNQTLEMTDDYSADEATYHLTTTPNHATLPTSAAEEIRHVRGGIKGITGEANWDDAPDATIVTLAGIALQGGLSPNISMVWKDVATITVQAGNYYCGNAWLNVSVATDWSWTLDTGTEATSTWYYLYLANVASTPTAVASITAPTGRLNTGLSGTTYDTNIYLGAFYNSSGSDVLRFFANKNKTLFLTPQNEQTTTNAAYQAKTARIPTTAFSAIIDTWVNYNIGEGDRGTISIDGATDYYNVTCGVSTGGGDPDEIKYMIEIPIATAQTIYIRLDTGGIGIYFRTFGWIDKWL